MFVYKVVIVLFFLLNVFWFLFGWVNGGIICIILLVRLIFIVRVNYKLRYIKVKFDDLLLLMEVSLVFFN